MRIRSIHSFDTRNVSEIVQFVEIKSKKRRIFPSTLCECENILNSFKMVFNVKY